MTDSHAERILALLRARPCLNDDEIAAALGIEPRQTVNQICRRLAAKGVLMREPGSRGKLVNRLTDGGAAPPGRAAQPAPRPGTAPPAGYSLIPKDMARTLIVIPCSGRKRDGRPGNGERTDSILRHLPGDIGRELENARAAVKQKIPLDEENPVPAWQRYDGSLYEAARPAIGKLLDAGVHIIILSGFYGAVLAGEPIGFYDTALKPVWWPHRIIERVLVAYAKEHGLSSVRAFASESSTYRKVLQRVDWHGAGIADALMLLPEAQPGGMRKSPATLGEALAALQAGTLTSGWRSSYGLGLTIQRD